MTEKEMQELLLKNGRIWSPSAPINTVDLFAGRLQQISTVSEAVNGRGRHAILYGDRGVGKTSLANILREHLSGYLAVRIIKVNCSATDTFENVWRKAFSEIPMILENPQASPENALPQIEEYTLDQYLANYTHIGPGEIRKLLERACDSESEILIVFDEFDTLAPEHRRIFADTIKDLSDNSSSVTILLVGVTSDVADLISDHQSIDRCLTQIQMPPMTKRELQTIITKRLKELNMTMSPDASDLIVSLSQGYPHYTHLLGHQAATKAISTQRTHITSSDTFYAINYAVQATHRTIRGAYQKAAESRRGGSIYPQVLLACALAKMDDMGYFRASDVSEPLTEIMGEAYSAQDFTSHLNNFSTDQARGPVLERWGERNRYRYRFHNAMLKPFIIMKGLDDKTITGSLLEKLTGMIVPDSPSN